MNFFCRCAQAKNVLLPLTNSWLFLPGFKKLTVSVTLAYVSTLTQQMLVPFSTQQLGSLGKVW